MQVLEFVSHKKPKGIISDVFVLQNKNLHLFLVGKYDNQANGRKNFDSNILSALFVVAEEAFNSSNENIDDPERLFYATLSAINTRLKEISKAQNADFFSGLSLAACLVSTTDDGMHRIFFSKKGAVKIFLKQADTDEIADLSYNFEEQSFLSGDFFKNIGIGFASDSDVLFLCTNDFVEILQEKGLDENFFLMEDWIDFWKFAKFYRGKILKNAENCALVSIFGKEEILKSFKGRGVLHKLFSGKTGLIVIFLIILFFGFLYNHFLK